MTAIWLTLPAKILNDLDYLHFQTLGNEGVEASQDRKCAEDKDPGRHRFTSLLATFVKNDSGKINYLRGSDWLRLE